MREIRANAIESGILAGALLANGGTLDDGAHACSFRLSDEVRSVTGQRLAADGGPTPRT